MLYRNYLAGFLAISMACLACSDNDVPVPENEEENITRVDLVFTPETGGSPQTIRWNDPDGEAGPQPPTVQPDTLSLLAATTYTLQLSLANELSGIEITSEIEEEAGEHLFYFGWTDALFSAPEGNGNLDMRADEVLYQDSDVNGLPLGLATRWITDVKGAKGSLQLVLKHQPGIKSASSELTDGSTDLNIILPIKIM